MIYCIVLALCAWQQQVSYKIEADLDTGAKKLSAIEYFCYYNNSPTVLETIYMHLYPNAYKDANTAYSHETAYLPGKKFRDADPETRGFINISSVTSEVSQVDYKMDTTILSIILDQPLNPGDSIQIIIEFEIKLPKIFSRFGYRDEHYEFVQWYPKACVFDQQGWHLDTYHAIGEFYGEYGDYDIIINLPVDYVVAATGMQRPAHDDGKLTIYKGNQKTVRFIANNVHDFAWVCDPDFLTKEIKADHVEVTVFFRRKNRNKWRNVDIYTIGAICRFNRWFGKYPYPRLSIVEGMSPMSGMEYPMLIIINESDDPLTRMSELCIAHEIAHQWFYGALGFNEMDEAWLDEGLATYAENRYFEDRYGKNGTIFKTNLFPYFSRRYYNMVLYYITQTNGLERPVSEPAYELYKEPIAYLNNAYSKPALFLTNLESYMGRETFERVIQTLYARFKFKHPKTDDFIDVCEEVSGLELDSVFHYFLNSTEFCDWDIEKISENKVTIKNNGKWLMPTEVLVRTNNGAQMFYLDGSGNRQTFSIGDTGDPIRGVTIDPNNNCIDINRWNNHYPVRVSIKPYLQFPSFDSYQILVLPYPWYGTDDGITLNLYLFGAWFVDYDFLKGRHQWLTGFSYGTKSRNVSTSVNYQTPLVFTKHWRMRINLKGSQNWWKENVNIGFSHNIGVAFTQGSKFEINNNVDYFNLDTLAAVDTIDWELGRVITVNNHIKFIGGSNEVNFNIQAAHKCIGSDYEFIKASLAFKKEVKALVPFSLRLFGGYVIGNAPLQDNFFLSGALRITMIPDLIFGPKGYFSPQKHIHIPGDGNMRGYQTMHIKSSRMMALNLEFPSRWFLRAFADIGWYDQWVWDAGVRVVLGPISFNVPLYVKDEGWRVNWSIGF